MGQNEINDSLGAVVSPERDSLLNQFVLTQSINDAKAGGKASRPDAAPDSAIQRVIDVTVDGITKVPQGIKNSLDVNNILPNVAVGFAVGVGAKMLLPAGGPVGKVIAGVGSLYFLGKPLVESYGMAINADTKTDMEMAGTHLGNSIGGMPIAIAEGAAGAKLGTMAGSKLLGFTPKVDLPLSSKAQELSMGSRAGVDAQLLSKPPNLRGEPMADPTGAQGIKGERRPSVSAEFLGGRNEHLSDVTGTLLERHLSGQPASETGWLVGKDVFGPQAGSRALRDMKSPGTAYDDPMRGKNK